MIVLSLTYSAPYLLGSVPSSFSPTASMLLLFSPLGSYCFVLSVWFWPSFDVAEGAWF
jgi:hypothetical protein